MSSSCSRRPARAASIATGEVLALAVPDADLDYGADLAPIVDKWTSFYAATEDVHDGERYASEVPEGDRLHTRGIEVGQVFYFGTKYSKPLGAKVAAADGTEHFVHMGSYGVGVSRLVGAVIEASHDEAGIIWPESIAPFDLGLINLKPGDGGTDKAAEGLYQRLTNAGIDVLYDDVDARAGAKFATMDLIGLPWQLIVGPKGVARGEVELKRRASGERETLTLDAAVNRLAGG